MSDLNKYRSDTTFGIISALLKCNTGYNVRFMCGDEEYKVVSMVEDVATKTVIVDMQEVSKQDPADKYYYILDELRDNPIETMRRFPIEQIVAALDWGMKKIDKESNDMGLK